MKDLFGQDIAPVSRQCNLLTGRAGLGVEAVWRVVNGIEYVRTASGYYVRADGAGPLLVQPPTEGSPK
jgi:hypothetical protein